MEWILIAGALCLSSHHDICIKDWPGNPGLVQLEMPSVSPVRGLPVADLATLAQTFGRLADEDAGKECDFAGDKTATKCHPKVGISNGLPLTACGTEDEIQIGIPKCPGFYSPPVELGPTFANSAPYGMTKEEFGRFIEDHVFSVMSNFGVKIQVIPK